jgi:hypothetical protein
MSLKSLLEEGRILKRNGKYLWYMSTSTLSFKKYISMIPIKLKLNTDIRIDISKA